MNKTQLIDALADRFGGSRREAAHALDAVLDTITRQVAKGERVAITGFGSFEKAVRNARWVRNPQTGERVKTKKKSVPKFSAGAELKAVVAGARKPARPARPTRPDPGYGRAAATHAPAKKAAAAVKKAPAKKAPAAVKKAPAKKAPAAVKKAPAKKAPAAVKKAPAKKAPAAVKKAPAKKAPAAVKKAPAKKAPAAVKKAPAKKAPAKKV
ncbi:HU family DNA-binding protein [Nocardioides sp. QY071]|uniref:HU family DNA-binding protein n=1 Tax=Nocardioides sp. QY071 TaxID=3044187 RepID=UPI00249C69C9|nr:HU family DNA-binding protein [Nocardioides sp. QY071]WGY03338.1 HU family DNA-binding protein [Nocardioides sp. QY071]